MNRTKERAYLSAVGFSREARLILLIFVLTRWGMKFYHISVTKHIVIQNKSKLIHIEMNPRT